MNTSNKKLDCDQFLMHISIPHIDVLKNWQIDWNIESFIEL